MYTVPLPELEGRIRRFQEELAMAGLDGALILQNTDLFYFSGTAQQGQLLIPREGPPVLWVRRSLSRARQESSLADIRPATGSGDLAAEARTRVGGGLGRLGLELDVLPASLYLRYQKVLPGVELADVSPIVKRVRAVKSAWEMERLQEAAAVADAIHRAVLENLREGMRELDLAAAVEAAARRSGHQGFARFRGFNQEMYYGHLLSGPSGAVPSFLDSPTGGPGLSPAFPQGPGVRPIGRGEPVLVDYVGACGGYAVDQTRTYCLGPLPGDFKDACRTALAIQNTLCRESVPGATAARMYELAAGLAAGAGLAERFMGTADARAGFVGHGIGLEIDEYPPLAPGVQVALAEWMVLALEPKFTFPGRGTVGIENTFVVRKEGLTRLNISDDGPFEL